MERLKRTVFSFWFLLVCIVFVSAFFASYYYWETFGGQRSSNSSDWSAFGSYFGGVFGPLISFCTLLAVLKTVYLQRELLDAQKEEFGFINNIQAKTLASQSEQLVLAKTESQQSEIQAYQTSQINLVEMFMEHQRRIADNLEVHISSTKVATIPYDQKSAALKNLQQRKIKANDAANALLVLALEISVTQFTDVVKIKGLLAQKLPNILDLEMPSSDE
ncbi:hypothetical protein [Pseudomonas sp. MUP55]|uniref:hypothetical protein n=1 Tax=Pseudomonas sp. MUP55 TaxID=3087234 RepID=UPI002A598B12|nr:MULTISPECIES: hypothetical protein [unclassified Pseudomonas]WPN90325.1 hypothetical protein SC319_13700 [Pseudomonas sp. MUP56]WPN95850.1 hypothetical protein SC318_13705 [Pseudomonas sp. MUP55]